jgi:RNA recognition motif. (a.k.a. RRM, RBD, or RNP domain)
MLVEMRLRFSGKLSGQKPKKRPDKFTSKYEEALWTKPAFAELVESLKKKQDHNAQNVVAEYMNNKELARQRYGNGYESLLRQVEEALTAPPPVKTTTIKFSGFPANMGEQACRMTLESLGSIVDFECSQDEDFPVLKGKVTFEDIESAKKAVAQYNGMDMGMGTALELVSV